MKKFTLLFALFVCAIGFSQKAISVTDAPPVRVANQEVVMAKQNIALEATSFNTMTDSDMESISNLITENNRRVLVSNPRSSGGTQTFTSLGDFNAACDGDLTSEDFSGGPGGIEGCGTGPMSSAGNGCYGAGELEEGFQIEAFGTGLNETVFIGAGEFGNTIDFVGANSFVDTTFLTFTGAGPVNSVGQVIFNLFGTDTEYRVYDDGGILMDTFNLNNAAGTENFFGVMTDYTIGHIEIEGTNVGSETELIGNLLFGDCSGGGGGEGTACSQEVFSNNFEGGGGNLNNTVEIADDFVVYAGSDFTVNQVTVNIINNGGFNDVVVAFYENDGGLPGAQVGSFQTVVPSSSTVIGTAFGRGVNRIVLDISPVTLNSDPNDDLHYWLGIETPNPIDGASDAYYEATSIPGPNFMSALDVADGGFFTNEWGHQSNIFKVDGLCAGEVIECDNTDYVAVGLPVNIDGDNSSTADCENEPNLVTVTAEGQNVIGVNSTIENVTIDLTHSWDSDLTISLVAPSGTELVLSAGNGSDGDNYIGTVFIDAAPSIITGSPPFTGNFSPEGGTFADAFDGEAINGDWSLKVCDAWSGDTGQIVSFSLTLCNEFVPNNDTCEEAFSVSCDDVVTGTTSEFKTDTGGNAAPDAWYSFTGFGSREFVTISLCDDGTDFDTYLRVFDACDGTEIATNDDSCGLVSEVGFMSDGTTTYYIMVEGFSSASGNYVMSVSCAIPPANDLCGDAADISCDSSVMGTTTNASFDDVGECGDATNTSAGVWYVLDDDSGLPGNIHINTCSDNTDYDTKISVFTGGCDDLICVTGNDDDFDNCTGFQSSVDFATDGDTTFYILVHGFSSATGDFELTVDCTRTPPANDEIANSIDLGVVGCPFTDEDVPMPAATVEGGNPENCNIDGANGVWYNITPAGDGEITATVGSPAGATFVTFYTTEVENPSVEDLTLLYVENNGENQCVPGTTTTVPVVAGQSYYIFVVNSGGRSDISITCELLGTNDNVIEGFNYYPNPANNAINLSAVDNIESVVIYNILGQKVIDLNVESTSTQINVSNLNTGTYLMKVSVNGEVGTYKVIKR